MARISIFGGTGYAGGNIAREAVSRGHQVVSYSRTGQGSDEGVEYRAGAITDPATVAQAAQADVLVVATPASGIEGGLASHVPDLVRAATAQGTRIGVVGGAGASLVAEGGPRLLDTPDFHPDWKPEATAHADVLEALQTGAREARWFYISPAALFGSFAPGETTGAYRTGGDVLVTAADGSSQISGTDYAKAFVDEIEHPAHENRRFTVGH